MNLRFFVKKRPRELSVAGKGTPASKGIPRDFYQNMLFYRYMPRIVETYDAKVIFLDRKDIVAKAAGLAAAQGGHDSESVLAAARAAKGALELGADTDLIGVVAAVAAETRFQGVSPTATQSVALGVISGGSLTVDPPSGVQLPLRPLINAGSVVE